MRCARVRQQPYPALKSIYLDTGKARGGGGAEGERQQRGTFRNKRRRISRTANLSEGETREPTCSPFPSFPRKRTRGILT